MEKRIRTALDLIHRFMKQGRIQYVLKHSGIRPKKKRIGKIYLN
jgi:hypothetical protein